MRVIIMRGIPGSGKSTWHAKNYPVSYVCSADLFMTDEEGNYRFDPTKLPLAHDSCLRLFLNFIESPNLIGSSRVPANHPLPIIVDNTNVRMYELAPYYRVTEALGHDVEIVHVLCDPSKAAERNTHGVPVEKVLEMAKSFEPVPPWWKVRYVFN